MARLSVLIIYSQYLRICSHTLCLPAQICHFGRGQQCVTFFFTLFPPSWPLSSRMVPVTMFALITPKHFHSLLVLAFVSPNSFSSQLSTFQDACFSSLSAAFFPHWVLELTPASQCAFLIVFPAWQPPSSPATVPHQMLVESALFLNQTPLLRVRGVGMWPLLKGEGYRLCEKCFSQTTGVLWWDVYTVPCPAWIMPK